MKKATCEEMRKILAGQDGMPPKFTVTAVADAVDSWICRFTDDAKAGRNADKIADDTDPDTAKKAYEKEDPVGFVQVWENESEDGSGESFAAQVLSEKDIALFKGEKFGLFDKL